MARLSHRFLVPLGLGASLLVVALAPRPAHADGAPLPPYGQAADIEMPGQKAIIVYDAESTREDLILSVQLLGESPEAAWVVPVPSPPEVKTASAEWFSHLSDLTQPEIVTETLLFPTCAATAPGSMQAGVELLSRERVGVYDVSVLSADEPDALLEWLNENGYSFPEEGKPILNAYVEEGWYFMATRVLAGETAHLEGDVQPLWLSFKTPRPVYPMRLTALVDNYMDVLLYVLADHRMEVVGGSRFDAEFAGNLTLEPVVPQESDLVDLLTNRPYYVTKLRRWRFTAQEIEDDLYLQRAPTDEPYRRVVRRRVVHPLTVWCFGLCSGLALPIAALGMCLVKRRTASV